MKYLILLAVPIASLLFAYAGFLYFSSGVSAQKEAKGIFTDVLFGFVIALCGFLIVDTIIKTLVNGNFVGPSWNTVQCVNGGARNIASGGIGFSQQPDYGSGLVRTSSAPPGVAIVPGAFGSIPEAINNYYGKSTAAGPDGGNLACAWAVNNVLVSAGVKPLGGNDGYSPNWVPSMEYDLNHGRGTPVDQAVASPGDIVIRSDGGHVGMCVNVGCSQVISNSSSAATFNYKSSTNFDRPGTARIYRLTN